MILLSLVLAASVPRSVRVVATPQGDRLVIDSRSYPVSHLDEPRFNFGSGIVRPAKSNLEQWVIKGKVQGSIDLGALTAEWLKDDSNWGGHDFANQMRYMAAQGGGVSSDFTEMLQAPNGDGLGVLDFHWSGPSLNPVAAQFLVKLHPKPFRFEIVRFIPVTTPQGGYFERPRRLFSVGPKLFCIDVDTVDQIDWDGKVVSTLCSWDRTDMPKGMSANRWIIGLHAGGDLTDIRATDLVRGKSFSLFAFKSQNPPIVNPPDITANSVSESSAYVLLWQMRNDTSAVNYFTVHVPDGRRRTLAGTANMLAGVYAVDTETGPIKLYSAATGRLLHVYPAATRPVPSG